MTKSRALCNKHIYAYTALVKRKLGSLLQDLEDRSFRGSEKARRISRTKPMKFIAPFMVREGWTMSKLCEAVVFLLLAFPAVAQSQAFEVISIKPARSGDPRDTRMPTVKCWNLPKSRVS